MKKSGDRIDYLRNDDVCPGDDGTFKKSNCPKPPKCDGRTKSLGKEKLCINRALAPNGDFWYIAAMVRTI